MNGLLERKGTVSLERSGEEGEEMLPSISVTSWSFLELCLMMELIRGMKRAQSKLTNLDFWRADFGLFDNLIGREPWDKALEGREI